MMTINNVSPFAGGGEITTVIGTLSDTSGWSISNYPNGFNRDNCTIMSFLINCEGSYRTGQGVYNGEYFRTFAALDPTQISVYNTDGSLYGREYRIVLMKI